MPDHKTSKVLTEAQAMGNFFADDAGSVPTHHAGYAALHVLS